MTRPVLIYMVFAMQIVCAVFFVFDIALTVLPIPLPPLNWQFHELIEIAAALGLILGVVVSAILLRASSRRSDHIESQLRAASGAFAELMEERFVDWNLTPAEREVALFSIKGLSTHEIAQLRETSEGTVKAQTNAIYKKVGVSGRPQLLSLFIEDLLEGPIA